MNDNKRPIAIIDVDETLWAFNDALRKCAESHGYPFPTRAQCTEWGSIYKYIPKPDAIKLFDEVHEHQLDFEPYPDAKTFLDIMRKRFYVIVASHRDPSGINMLKEWLDKHDLYYDHVFVGFDKTVLFDDPNAAVVVDDRDETLIAGLKRGMIAVGLRKPWNEKAFTVYEHNNKTSDVPLLLYDNLMQIADFLFYYNHTVKVEKQIARDRDFLGEKRKI
jgi:beta-phosphoglucomutase-like phosphatase (HAD superfamily)